MPLFVFRVSSFTGNKVDEWAHPAKSQIGLCVRRVCCWAFRVATGVLRGALYCIVLYGDPGYYAVSRWIWVFIFVGGTYRTRTGKEFTVISGTRTNCSASLHRVIHSLKSSCWGVWGVQLILFEGTSNVGGATWAKKKSVPWISQYLYQE